MQLMQKVFALQDLGTIGAGGPNTGLGPLAGIAYGNSTGLEKITWLVSAMIGVMTVAAGIWFLFQFVIGGFFWASAGGDKAKLHEAKERITNALVGLLIVVAGWSILAITGMFLGYDILITSPGDWIDKLNIK